MKTRIYGASDDLIEIDGAIYEEAGCYGHKKPIPIEASDGTKGSIYYNGVWEIYLSHEGFKYLDLISNTEDDEHTGDASGCPSYSDVLILDDGIEWVKIGNKTFKRND